MKGTQSTEFRFNEPTTLAIRHTMTNNNRKQQHCCCSNNSSIAAHRAAAAAAAAAALCMHIKLTSRLLRRHLNHHMCLLLHWNKKKGKCHTKKTASGIRTTDTEVRRAATYLLPHSVYGIHRPRLVYIYTYVQIDVWENLTKKRKQHPPPGDDASTAEAAPGKVGRDEQGEARRANTTPNRVGRDAQGEARRANTRPNGGPHLAL